MDKYVVRQPIKDMDQNLFGYEILFQMDSDSSFGQTDDRIAADTIANFLLQNSDKIFEDKIAFLTFTPNLLFKNIPRIFKNNGLVIQIDDNVIIHPVAIPLIHRYRDQGYKVAVNDFQFAPRYFGIMDIIDYIRLNLNNYNQVTIANIVNMSRSFNKKCIACGVDTKEAFELAKSLQMDYMEGSYIAEKESGKVHHMEYLQSNFFQLVVEVTKDEPSLDAIEAIISRDVSLTYTLLKLVNSTYFALRRRATSIMQALVILGLGQLKQWVYLLSFSQEDEEIPETLIKTSFLRANFCAELSVRASDMPISKSEAYLMGMFSTLGNLMEIPLEEALKELNVVDEIKDALLNYEGRCGILYQLILCYEKADWKSITSFAEQLEIPKNIISQIYFECVDNVNTIWQSLMKPEENLLPPKEEEAKEK